MSHCFTLAHCGSLFRVILRIVLNFLWLWSLFYPILTGLKSTECELFLLTIVEY